MKQEDVEVLGENLAQKVINFQPLKLDITRYLGMTYHVSGDNQLLLRASFQTALDYLPQFHVLSIGNVINDIFIPLHAEMGTILDRKFPSHFLVTKTAVSPENNPITDLVNIDERFHTLMKSVVEYHEKTSGISHFKFRGEAFHHNGQTYVGIAFIPEIDNKLSLIKGMETDTEVKIRNYQFPRHLYEIHFRLSYYVNYLNYPFHSPSTISKTNLMLPAVLIAQESSMPRS